ncbi:MAG: LacI family transcriptional regulator [Lachnospiraceae bacterium]
MRTTIKDVAKMAGVSISTVSRVINHSEYGVDAALKERVWEAVRAMNYRPNQNAKSIVTNKTNTVAVLSPDVGHPFYHDIIIGMNEVALKDKYSVLLYNTNGDTDNEKATLDLIFSRSVDGIIFIGYFEEKLKGLMDKLPEVPVVVFDELAQIQNVGQVYVNDAEAFYEMTRYVIECGHRVIGCIIGPGQYAIVRNRLAGYKRALEDAGIPFDEKLIVQGNLTEESAEEPAEYLIRECGVSVILCFNDLMAYGVYKKCMEMGKTIPEDISVAGFDGIGFSEYLNPPLTTCYQPGTEMGSRAMSLLLDKIKGEGVGEEKICLKCQLKIRASVRNCHERNSSFGN